MESHVQTGAAGDGLVERFRAGRLNVYVYESRPKMGAAAAATVAAEVRRLQAERGRAVGIFASAPSQNEFLAALAQTHGIDWPNVKGFHLDEYLGMGEGAPQSFRRFLLDRLVNKVSFGEFHGLRGEAGDAAAECRRYAALLGENPPDFAVLGIGENGHLAFIDPPFCDFNDPEPVNALSLTIPTIMARPKLFAIVPGSAKAEAIKGVIEGPVETACPASILRNHPDAHLFID